MEDNFLLTPTSAARSLGDEMMLGTAGPSGGGPRKELRFDEQEQQEGGEAGVCLAGWGGLEWDEEAVSEHASEREAAEDLLWGLLGTSRAGGCLAGPAPRLSAAMAAAVGRVRPVCEQYAELLGCVERLAVRRGGAALAAEGLGWALDGLLQRHRAAVLALEQRLQETGWRAPLARLLHAAAGLGPPLTMLARAAAAAPHASSAEIVQALHGQWAAAAAPEERQALSCLLHAAAQAYLAPLSAWIAGDTLRDPFDELCVAKGGAELRAGPRHWPACLGGPETAEHLQASGQHAHVLARLALEEGAAEEALRARVLAELPLLEPPTAGLPEWAPERAAAWRAAAAAQRAALGTRLLAAVRREGRLEAALEALAAACLLQGRGGAWPRELGAALEQPLLDASLPRLQQLAELALPRAGLRLLLWPLSLTAQRSALVSPAGDWCDGPAADPARAAAAAGAAGAAGARVGQALGAEWRPPPGAALLLPAASVRAYGVASRRLLQLARLAAALARVWQTLAADRSRGRGLAAGLAACRGALAAVAALQRHFAGCHGPLWAALQAAAREGASLEAVGAAASAHLRAVLAALFLAVPAAQAEAAEVLLDTCEACVLFASRPAAPNAPAGQWAAQCATLQGLLVSAGAALAQQLRTEPACQPLVADLLAAAGLAH